MKKIILIMIIFLINFSYVNAQELKCTTTYSKGIKGSSIKVLQTNLNEIMDCNLKVDGIYGDATKQCVSNFQDINSIEKTGTVNKKTCQFINKLTNDQTQSQSTFCSTNLKKGSKGDDVRELQTKLNQVMNCNLEVDGIYGKLTKACVVEFQINSKLEPTGIIDNETCNKLSNQSTKVIKEKELEITSTSLIVIEDGTKIRRSMNTNSKVIKTSSLGEIFKYEGVYYKNKKNWYKVKINDSYGYVESKYISKNFIVVDITQQKLIMYKNKKEILNTEVVTGTFNLHDTPIGYYKLETKNLVDGKYLRGYLPDGTLEYKSWVDYWMPFITTRGIGFHDASWRSEEEFTSDRYLYDGSHGCINMKKEAAKTLFTNVDENIDVIIRK